MHVSTWSPGLEAPGLTIKGGMVKGDRIEIDEYNGGITIDGGALEAKKIDLTKDCFIDLEAGNLSLADNCCNFVIPAKQVWSAHRVIWDTYDSYWTCWIITSPI